MGFGSSAARYLRRMSQCQIHLVDGSDLFVDGNLDDLTGALQRDTFVVVMSGDEKVAVRGGQVVYIQELSDQSSVPVPLAE